MNGGNVLTFFPITFGSIQPDNTSDRDTAGLHRAPTSTTSVDANRVRPTSAEIPVETHSFPFAYVIARIVCRKKRSYTGRLSPGNGIP